VSGKSVELLAPGRSSLGAIDIVSYQIDGTLYIYNPFQKKWSSLDLKVPVWSPMHVNGEIATLIDGDVVHVYDAKTGEWTHINTKDDK
jgi:hypothetical protein